MPSNLPLKGKFSRRILTATTVLAITMASAASAASTAAQAAQSNSTKHAPILHKHPAAPKHAKKPAHHKKAKPKKAALKKPPAKGHASTASKPTTASPATRSGSAATPTAATATASPSGVPESPPGGAFGPTSFWRQSLIGAPVAAGSAAMVSTLASQVQAVYGGVAALNVWQYNASVYTVGASQPRADVHWDNCQGKPGVPTGLQGPGGQFTAVPIPLNAVAATGSDSELTVYSPSTDQIWDFWHAHQTADGWHACWGGRIDQVSTSLGYFTGNFGVSASAIAVGEPVSINDIRSGVINHAIPIAIPSPAISSIFSWPAQRSDGADTTASAMPEGTRLRLTTAIDLSTLNLTPIGMMIAKAAQKYGMVVVDRAGCVAVIGESGNGDLAQTGTNPWTTLLGGTPAYATLRNFPWAQLQAMPLDYGKPANAPS